MLEFVKLFFKRFHRILNAYKNYLVNKKPLKFFSGFLFKNFSVIELRFF